MGLSLAGISGLSKKQSPDKITPFSIAPVQELKTGETLHIALQDIP